MGDNLAYEDARVMAERYWNGEISDLRAKEVLFEGRLRIIEQIP